MPRTSLWMRVPAQRAGLYALSMEFTDAERATLLRALFELSITQATFYDDPSGP